VDVTADTQAILLLLSRLGQPKPRTAPLSVAEYDRLAAWLHQRETRPRDLLQATLIAEVPPSVGDAARIKGLLARGTTLGLALDGWASKGLWVIGRGDPDYPRRLKQKLRREAPPLLFGAGPVMTSTAEESPSSAHGRQTRRPWSSPGSSPADAPRLDRPSSRAEPRGWIARA